MLSNEVAKKQASAAGSSRLLKRVLDCEKFPFRG